MFSTDSIIPCFHRIYLTNFIRSLPLPQLPLPITSQCKSAFDDQPPFSLAHRCCDSLSPPPPPPPPLPALPVGPCARLCAPTNLPYIELEARQTGVRPSTGGPDPEFVNAPFSHRTAAPHRCTCAALAMTTMMAAGSGAGKYQ